ncbi:MAG: AMP-binding protein, partial [Proteobacteria bacterium]|nr:AMP-binding protein [Pseudomonadota bacterium]
MVETEETERSSPTENAAGVIDGTPSTVDARVTQIIAALASEISPGRILPAPFLDRSLEADIGFDSLTRMELVHRLELEFSVALPDRAIANSETPRDLVRALAGANANIVVRPDVEKLVAATGDDHLIPHGAETLVDVLEYHATHNADHTHIRLYNEDGDIEPITYGELWDGARRIAAGLVEHDVQPDESVLIMLPTGRDYFLCFTGILLAGAVPVPIYPPGRTSQIEDHMRRHTKIADTARAGLMITVPEAKVFS